MKLNELYDLIYKIKILEDIQVVKKLCRHIWEISKGVYLSPKDGSGICRRTSLLLGKWVLDSTFENTFDNP